MALVPRMPCWISRCRLNPYKSTRHLQTSSGTQSHDLPYPLFPSVSQLLHEKGISGADVSKIPASGPKGRLLKGDVLAFTGAIPRDYSSNLSAQISQLAHLDLSNIKVKQTPTEPQAKSAAAAVTALPPSSTPAQVSLPISLSSVLSLQERLQKTLGITIPLSTFLARATDVANEVLPASKSTSHTQSSDALFDEILGISPTKTTAMNPCTSRGNYVPEIIAPEEYMDPTLSASPREVYQEPDIIDILSGKSPPSTSTSTSSTRSGESESTSFDSTDLDLATNIFSIQVPSADRLRGETFLERLRDVLEDEPESLVF
ncbi:pyruvate dehydrogenase complex component Pdx1 [Histoplasma capsulatum var. duboisii H88]|uniref:Pyruvate dehydrogenase complex component Pdx1 n=1 Tax=Ajellomyces capsulatus (strain H88) TaxID=544711 RepID=F0UJ37_AJEC8|nr:pyruvate dehydrogenase complex component Pdx1 [Histoplasma capsulatum var. duboisii H88]QSS56338.1 pyruvate dehydrogenase complex component Pdx1 [Histoplasma capsulatum var. duboisii H88]